MPVPFQPTRTSPPLRLTRPSGHVPPAPASTNLSVVSSATVVVPELKNLTPDDISFIEAVVRRAGPLATTFPIVFRAYNDVLKERGVDAGEVRYYGKLLKLGTMKGKNWGEKWEAVKRHQPQAHHKRNPESVSSRVKSRSKLTKEPPPPVLRKLQDLDADTVPSDLDDEGEGEAVDVPQYHQTSNFLVSTMRPTIRKSSVSPSTQPKASMIPSLRVLPASIPGHAPPSDTSLSEAETIAPINTPTPNGMAVKEARYTRHVRATTPTSASTSVNFWHTSNNRFSGARRGVIDNRRCQDELDEDDAWNKIRIQQLEDEADRFRGERLVDRCWEVWKESYQWITTSHEQIDQARNAFLLRLAFHHWNNLLASHKARYNDVTILDNERRICVFLTLWRRKLREKQQTKWQANMRSKLEMIRDSQSLRILRGAWSMWTQKHQLALAERHYNAKLLLLAYLKWKCIFQRVDKIEGRAEHIVATRDQSLVLRCWETWRTTLRLTVSEKELKGRVYASLTWQAWSVWRKHTYDYRMAAFFRNRCLRKRFLTQWQGAMHKVHALEARADKHSARQDKILVCAVLRVWLAHVRGRQMSRQRNINHLYRSFSTWKKQMARNRELADLATTFYQKTSIRVISATLTQWQVVCKSHENRYATAERFDEKRLVKRFGCLWLSRYQEGIEERRRQKLVKRLQARQAARVLYHWLLLTRKRRRCTEAELLVQERIRQRTGRDTLSHWTQCVIFMRERDLHAIETYAMKLARNAWTRFKSAYSHHTENMKLLEDHLTLKEEDTLRRFFHRWKNAAHMVRHRRYILQEKEEKSRNVMLQKVWEKWMSSYLERRLRPLEIEMLMRSQQNLLYQAFSIWHAKAKTRPAIIAVKFNARHTKMKFYTKWREALPVAQKTRRFREKHDNLVLSQVFKQWQEAYRTKLVLKAVARARYLRLPASGARAIVGPLPITTSPSSSAPTPHHESKLVSSTKLYPIRPGSFSERGTTRNTLNEELMTDDKGPLNDHEPASTGGRRRPSRLSRSPFGLGKGTGIVSLLRTNNVYQNQQGKLDLSPPRLRYPMSKSQHHSGADTGYASLFASVVAESTPPNRGTRSTASDGADGRMAQWSRLRTNRRVREPSPSITSQFTESQS